VTASVRDAEELFGERWALAEAYQARLAGDGIVRGLLGPRERDRLWDRHILNCAPLASLLQPGDAVGDLGSGAGLPGIVIALLRTDVTVDLIEPLERRIVFLEETVQALGLTHCRVVRARADELLERRRGDVGGRTDGGRGVEGRYDVVTARAVAGLDRLVGWALPLLRPGGQLLAIKGASAEAELEAAAGTLARLGATDAEVLSVDIGHGAIATVVRVLSAPALGRRS
jgi:16S rRNA (guanine527-N7)-methyltransferase